MPASAMCCPAPHFFTQSTKGHGRLEYRCLGTFAVEAQTLDFPFARCLIVVRSKVTTTKIKRQSPENRFYLSSLRPDERTPAQWHALIRGHWVGVEIRNHWRRDAIWGEDRPRTRNPNALANLALLRSALLALIAKDPCERSLPDLIDTFANDPASAFSPINSL